MSYKCWGVFGSSKEKHPNPTTPGFPHSNIFIYIYINLYDHIVIRLLWTSMTMLWIFVNQWHWRVMRMRLDQHVDYIETYQGVPMPKTIKHDLLGPLDSGHTFSYFFWCTSLPFVEIRTFNRMSETAQDIHAWNIEWWVFRSKDHASHFMPLGEQDMTRWLQDDCRGLWSVCIWWH